MILGETITYIKELEKKKKILEELIKGTKKMKQQPDHHNVVVAEGSLNMLPCTTTTKRNINSSSSITVTVSGNVAFFGIQSKAQRGLITAIIKVFQKHNTEVLAANVSVNNGDLIERETR